MLHLFSTPLLASEAAAIPLEKISWGLLITGLLGGLGLFLYGIEKMSEGMKLAAGNRFRAVLKALTANRVIALFFGAVVTMVVQSSSATTVMLVGFVEAGLMGFSRSVGVILGADIGTTVTAQLIAFKLTNYALLLVAVGAGLRMFARNDNLRNAGEAVLGFGMLFLGMKLMSETMHPLRSYPQLIDFMRGLENPLAGLLAGTLLTALLQSSSAFIGIVIVLAQQGLISLQAGIPMILGANVGTCITAGLASIGASRDAKRVAIAHVFFKVGGVLLFIFWIPTFSELITSFGAKFGFGNARNIANAHTVFNFGLTFAFLPFTHLIADWIMKIFPDQEEEKGLVPAIWHLDEGVLSNPSIAIELARSEISRMAKIVGRMVESVLLPFVNEAGELRDKVYPQLSLVEGISMREEKLDYLEEKVGEYLIRIGRRQLSKGQMEEVYQLMSIIKDMESIGDVIHRNVVPQIDKKEALSSDFSREGKDEITYYHGKICDQMDELKRVFENMDYRKAKRIMQVSKEHIKLEAQFRKAHIERVRNRREESLITHEVHMELMDLMKQINGYVINIAKTVKHIGRNEEFSMM